MEVKDILKQYYDEYDEDSRLEKDKAHQVEFITTIEYINKYLKPGDKILEVGAGTGRYSLYFAEKGYEVHSVELVESNLNILKSKIKDGMKISAKQGNALDLGVYEDNSFDITLCLGPLYHLFTEEDKRKAISEAIRVTKQNGIIYIVYISNDAVVLSYGLRKGNLKRLFEISGDNRLEIKDIPEEIFSTNYIKEFEDRMKNYNIKQLHHVATDGLSGNMADYINNLDDEEYDIWVKYHLLNCEREDLIGYSSHVLYICKKE